MIDIQKAAKFFKAYDMRGTLDNLDEEVYYLFGKALINEVLKPEDLELKVAVLYDVRVDSERFYNALINGITEAGGEVIALGLGSTDILYAAANKWKIAGCMVTASHNPPEYNGCKVVKKSPEMMGLDNGLEKVRGYVVENYTGTYQNSMSIEVDIRREELDNYFIKEISRIGRVAEADEYLIKNGRKLKVVIDTANGCGGIVAEMIKNLYENVELVPLYWELDGTFPNHPADPDYPENLEDLSAKVVEVGADYGAMFDGDADRCYLVDQKGEPISNNFLITKIAQEMVESYYINPVEGLEPIIVVPIADSRMIVEQVFLSGGAVMPTRYGHTFVKGTMAKYKAIYGGEASGHHYFGEFGMMDSGVLTFLYSIFLMAKGNLQATDIRKPYDEVFSFSGWYKYKLEGPFEIEELLNKLKTKYPDGHISQIEGVQISYPLWKATIRASNTEPVLKISVEAKTGADPMEKLKELESLIK